MTNFSLDMLLKQTGLPVLTVRILETAGEILSSLISLKNVT